MPSNKLLPCSPVRSALLWFALALLIHLPCNGMHSLWDRDETRFAASAAEMIRTGDYVVPHLNGEPRYHKPVLIYYLMSIPMQLWGVNEFSARFVSSLAGASSVMIIFLLALNMGAGTAGASLAAAVALLSAMLFLISSAATTDAVLTLTVLVGIYLYWQQHERGFHYLIHLFFWIDMALTLLLKGPVGWLFVGSAIMFATREHKPRWPSFPVRLGTGILILLIIALPWAVLAWQRTSGEFFRELLGIHVWQRSLRPMEGHGGPLFYYLPILLLDLFPASALALLALRWGWANRAAPAIRLLLGWCILPLIVFSLVRTKLPHYIAPLLPAFAVLIGLWWSHQTLRTNHVRWRKAGAIVMSLLGLALLLGPGIAAHCLNLHQLFAPILTAEIVAGLGAIAGSILWWRARMRQACIAWLAGAALTYAILIFWGLRAIEPYRQPKLLLQELRANCPPDIRLFASGFTEASVFFYWNAPVTLAGKDEARQVFAALHGNRPAALLVTEERWRNWLKEQPALTRTLIVHRPRREVFRFLRDPKRQLLLVSNCSKSQIRI